MAERIFHLALAGDWAAAHAAGESYERSTLGKSLREEGFIHCSFRDQVPMIARLVFSGRDDVVVLSIDPDRIPSPIRVENLDGGDTLFPHIYGPLPLDAVVSVTELAAGLP